MIATAHRMSRFALLKLPANMLLVCELVVACERDLFLVFILKCVACVGDPDNDILAQVHGTETLDCNGNGLGL
jgi:hypothetical protein